MLTRINLVAILLLLQVFSVSTVTLVVWIEQIFTSTIRFFLLGFTLVDWAVVIPLLVFLSAWIKRRGVSDEEIQKYLLKQYDGPVGTVWNPDGTYPGSKRAWEQFHDIEFRRLRSQNKQRESDSAEASSKTDDQEPTSPA